jgi:hypothetical protein
MGITSFTIEGPCTCCLYIQLTPCASGTGNYWVSIPVWQASGHSIYYDGTDCYQAQDGNTTASLTTLTAGGGTVVAAPTLDSCADSPCPGCDCSSQPSPVTITWVDSNPTPNVSYSATMTTTPGSCSYTLATKSSDAIISLSLSGGGSPCTWSFSINGGPTTTKTGASPTGGYPPDGAGNIDITIS